MAPFCYPFEFIEADKTKVHGTLELDEPLPYQQNSGGSGFYRPGKIFLEDSPGLDLVLYHNPSTATFMYTRCCQVDRNLLDIIGLTAEEIERIETIRLPGQLCLGSDRSKLIGQAIRDLFASPVLGQTIAAYSQHNLAIFPIAREGLKYQVAEALYEDYGYYCDEIILDAHHVFDSSVPVYNRKVEMTLFKDKDLDRKQKDNISVAFIADSIASGMVLKEVIARVKERFDKINRVEVIAPLATLRGLSRIARSDCGPDTTVRVHVFETLLNALPPDYYYSAHYDIPEFHIRPDLESEYRRWWGQDPTGKFIADTACAGYGWSEVFFSPRKQMEMINGQLGERHQMNIAEIVRRNLI